LGILKNTAILAILLLLCFPANGQEYHLDICHRDTNRYVRKLKNDLQGAYSDSSQVILKLRNTIGGMRKSGYLAASFDSLLWEGDTLRALLHTGEKYRWGRFSLHWPNSVLFRKTPFTVQIRENQVVDLNELNAWQEEIITYLEDRGYPFAAVSLTDLENTGSDTLNAMLSVDPGRQYFIDSVLVKGENPVSEKFLYPYLEIFPGMVYNESKLQAISDKIDNNTFLREIRDFELEFSKDNRVDLFLYLERAESNRADGVVGFLPEGDGRFRFTGSFDLRLNNIFKRGEHIALNWKSLEEQTQELNLNFDYPYLLFNSLGVSTGFELYKKDTSFLSRKIHAGMPFFVGNQTKLEIFGDFENSGVISESVEASGRYEDFSLRLYGLSYSFSSLDYPVNPSRGMKLGLFGSVGQRKGENDNNNTSAEIGADFSFYQPFFRNWVFNFSGRGRYKHMWTEEGAAHFRENELYRFGGVQSLRGFNDNVFLASAYSVITLELRYLLAKNSNVYAFWDGGWYHKEAVKGGAEDFPFGFGIGAHVDTGGGILYISYALGKQFDNPIEPGSAKIHLGYVSTF
jgi:outer membrane protein assembly factor BamA